VPAGTPRPIIDELTKQIEKLLADPATRDRLAGAALEPIPGSTPDSFAGYIKTEIDRWSVIVRNSGIKPE
jgi:tripartite-type tricarboxylate transporter receptor subunit TctC